MFDLFAGDKMMTLSDLLMHVHLRECVYEMDKWCV